MKRVNLKVLTIRFLPLIFMAAGTLFGIMLLPSAMPMEKRAGIMTLLNTYVTIASVLSGFSFNNRMQFTGSQNKEIIDLAKKNNVYRDIISRFNFSTFANLFGMLFGVMMILIASCCESNAVCRWGTLAVLAFGSLGFGAFAVSAWMSAKVADYNDTTDD